MWQGRCRNYPKLRSRMISLWMLHGRWTGSLTTSRCLCQWSTQSWIRVKLRRWKSHSTLRRGTQKVLIGSSHSTRVLFPLTRANSSIKQMLELERKKARYQSLCVPSTNLLARLLMTCKKPYKLGLIESPKPQTLLSSWLDYKSRQKGLDSS